MVKNVERSIGELHEQASRALTATRSCMPLQRPPSGGLYAELGLVHPRTQIAATHATDAPWRIMNPLRWIGQEVPTCHRCGGGCCGAWGSWAIAGGHASSWAPAAGRRARRASTRARAAAAERGAEGCPASPYQAACSGAPCGPSVRCAPCWRARQGWARAPAAAAVPRVEPCPLSPDQAAC